MRRNALNTGKEGYSKFVKWGIALVLVILSLMVGANIWAFAWLGMGIWFSAQWLDQKRYHRANLMMFLTGCIFVASNNYIVTTAAANALLLTVLNYGWQVWDWWHARRVPGVAADGTR
jgi:hypothetical protein